MSSGLHIMHINLHATAMHIITQPSLFTRSHLAPISCHCDCAADSATCIHILPWNPDQEKDEKRWEKGIKRIKKVSIIIEISECPPRSRKKSYRTRAKVEQDSSQEAAVVLLRHRIEKSNPHPRHDELVSGAYACSQSTE